MINISELEEFLFGGQIISFDGTYKPAERKIISFAKRYRQTSIGYIKIDFERGKITTYNSKGNPDN